MTLTEKVVEFLMHKSFSYFISSVYGASQNGAGSKWKRISRFHSV